METSNPSTLQGIGQVNKRQVVAREPAVRRSRRPKWSRIFFLIFLVVFLGLAVAMILEG